MQIQTSDISSAEYRFLHSTRLINSDGSTTNSLPLRIVACDDLDEGIISVNNKHVKVTLPSFTNSDGHMSPQYRDECKVIYGGEHYHIAKDDTGSDDIMMNRMQNKRSQQSFEIQDAGSCLVANFLGIVGYEQALVLPQVNTEVLSKLGSTDMKDEMSIQQQKELLYMIIRHSFLTMVWVYFSQSRI